MPTTLSHPPRSIAVVSTFPPTRCGLASFSSSLLDAFALVHPNIELGVVAVDGADGAGAPVVTSLRGGDAAELHRVAAELDGFDIVIIQHEYGIFAGPDGASVVDLMRRLRRPPLVVLHTVLDRPSQSQRRVLEQVVDLSAAAIVMTRVAARRLLDRYVVEPAKLQVIPHGTFLTPAAIRLGPQPPAPDRPLLLTWGLLGPGKGIETAIDAAADLVDLDPLPRYVIAGQTHPKVREHHGEAYREMLQARAADLGVAHIVEFDDRYFDLDALQTMVRSATAVVLPYESTEQVTSGVLVDAIGGGAPVVSTAFPHAVEVAAAGAGLTVPHGDTTALAGAMRKVLADSTTARFVRANARDMARELAWDRVARRYLAVAADARRAAPRLLHTPRTFTTSGAASP